MTILIQRITDNTQNFLLSPFTKLSSQDTCCKNAPNLFLAHFLLSVSFHQNLSWAINGPWLLCNWFYMVSISVTIEDKWDLQLLSNYHFIFFRRHMLKTNIPFKIMILLGLCNISAIYYYHNIRWCNMQEAIKNCIIIQTDCVLHTFCPTQHKKKRRNVKF